MTTKRSAQPVTAMIACAVWLGCLPTGAGAQSTENITDIGTLTCTATPGEDQPLGPERELSCTFDPLHGEKVSLKGVVKQVGPKAVPGSGKIVLVWSVLGPAEAQAPDQLEGRFIGTLGDGPNGDAGGLVGGANGSVKLRPLAPVPGSKNNAALAVIELQLVAMKA